MIGLWTMDIPTIVFSRVTMDFSEELKKAYGFKKTSVKLPGMTEPIVTWNKFATSQISESPPEFPYITIIEMPGQERGQVLEADRVNGQLFSFQVDVYDNKSTDKRAKNCIYEVARIMAKMGFRGRQMPTPNSTSSQEVRYTARFEREIDEFDVF